VVRRFSALEKMDLTPTHSNIMPSFWGGKRVLVTGHTGFKGSWMSLWLQSLGADLQGIALAPPTRPALFEVADVAKGMRHCIADTRSFDAIRELVEDFKPEIIIHMAAQPLVRLSYDRPLETYATNVMGTLNVLEAARHCASVKAIVNVTSDKCYENRELFGCYREDEPMGGQDPYSNSKGCAELVSAAYRHSFLRRAGIALATARAGNVIGGGDWAQDRLLPDILRALEGHKPVQIRNPYAVRPWQHVLEPLSGYLVLAERLCRTGQEEAEAWNFGPHEETPKSVQWIVENMCELWGDHAGWTAQPGVHPHEASFLRLDISKVRQRLNWQPRWPIDIALRKTAEWHRAWIDERDMRAFCLDQIRQYENE
jgi:CDP-glucose 4,6-dehydratase